MTTSLFDVLARWGYSEIHDGTSAAYYVGGPIEALRGKRQQGADFADLTPQERYTLAWQCALVRSALLAYFVGIERFSIDSITRFQLGHLLVPPNVWYPQSENRACPFSHYIETESEDARDARRVQAPPLGYVAPTDPLTVGYANGYYVLIDGYHRAASFWRFGPPNGTLPVNKPQVTPDLAQVVPPF